MAMKENCRCVCGKTGTFLSGQGPGEEPAEASGLRFDRFDRFDRKDTLKTQRELIREVVMDKENNWHKLAIESLGGH